MKEKSVDNNCNDLLTCSCGHCHEEKRNDPACKDESVFQRYAFDFVKIILSALLVVLSAFVVTEPTVKLIIYLISFLIIGYEVVFDCFKNVFNKSFFNEVTLMLIASVAAFCLGEYFEGVLILILYNIGELLEEIATENSRKKIVGLSELKNITVHLITEKGAVDVSSEPVECGSLLEVKRGEKIPIDGVLFAGNAVLDMKAITGESNLSNIVSGEKVFSGSINVGDPIIIKTEKLYKDSTVAQIVAMVEGALSKKAKSQKFITAFARVYTPAVALLTLVMALIPPLFDGMNFYKWIYKALSVLVISCPCALVISVPLAFFVGIGSLAKNGVLVKGSNCLEVLAKAKTAVFDKTGTITEGNFKIDKIICENGFFDKEVVEYAVLLERESTHPLSRAIVSAACDVNSSIKPVNVKELSGMGMVGDIGGKNVIVGNRKLMQKYGVNCLDDDYFGSVVLVAVDGLLAGKILLCDQIKAGTLETIKSIKNGGISKTVMLSGDRKSIAENVADKVGVDQVFSELLPIEKTEIMKEIKASSNGTVFYVGDGINDSPTLAAADVGIAMGGLGSEIAVESSDIVVMDDDVRKIADTFKFSKKVRRTVLENIIGSLLIKASVMVLSVFITLPIYLAMFADVGCMLLAILNSLKNNKIK